MTESRVATEAAVPPGSLLRVDVDGVGVCVARTEVGEWFAVSDTCSHEEYSLSEGDLFGRDVECPMHGSRFDLATGMPDQLPATVPIRTYPITVRDGEVYVNTEKEGDR